MIGSGGTYVYVTHTSIYVCVFVCVYVYMYVCMYVCMYIRVCVCDTILHL